MACIVYKMATCLLLLTAVRSTGVQPKQIIYADKGSWILDSNHRENEPCARENVEAALDGAEQHNSTSVLLKQKCKSVPIAESHDGSACPTWFLPDSSANGTCRCGDDVHGVVICNDPILSQFCSQ